MDNSTNCIFSGIIIYDERADYVARGIFPRSSDLRLLFLNTKSIRVVRRVIRRRTTLKRKEKEKKLRNFTRNDRVESNHLPGAHFGLSDQTRRAPGTETAMIPL